ncbi:helix-turn-helix domain-containing protein [Psychromarinibacter sp. C21-152]|uniref:Helix-turn-helix domain-containing protein n=1 Tax=Psychromarinibacter sediminicola TaxID=3033385 RepID=A0AAE3T9Z4_9RHOB|nr:helix-turn-helix domain-containing protein [Psychromarinibacter sediminicola]MDF0602318.1 helix-turn-helix domain-containing protein [Psychromarinibacter sediminicola]
MPGLARPEYRSKFRPGARTEARADAMPMDDLPSVPLPKPTTQVAPYVEVLGYDLAIDFLMTFGGSELYIAERPGTGSRLVQLVGMDKARELAAISHLLPRVVPLAKPWLAKVFFARGLSKNDIARTLRVSVVTVRGWLRP